jgi:hypothetical protein
MRGIAEDIVSYYVSDLTKILRREIRESPHKPARKRCVNYVFFINEHADCFLGVTRRLGMETELEPL